MGRYYIGMDGGGTSTKVLVWDGEKELLRISAGGLNYNSHGPDLVAETLKQTRDMLEANGFIPEDCMAVGVGCAGISNPVVRTFLEDTFLRIGYRCPISVFGDEEAAMFGAFGGGDGILLISGTGSVCLGQAAQGKNRYRAGGYGHLIDDEGSAYSLGRDILSAVVKAEDGRQKPTALKAAVFERINISSISELVSYVYDRNHTKKEIAEFASLLSRPGIKEDAAARQIMDKAAGELEELVKAVAGRMMENGEPEELLLVPHGSVLEKNEEIRERLGARLRVSCPVIRLGKGACDAARGAAEIAAACRDYQPRFSGPEEA